MFIGTFWKMTGGGGELEFCMKLKFISAARYAPAPW
jgi:hypothetical protein